MTQPAAMTSPEVRSRPWAPIVGLTLLALVVRIPGLNSGLWIDEIFSLLDSFRPPLATVLTEFPGDTQHPLYSVLANICIKIFGEAPWSMRLPALVFGVASVPMLYVVGEKMAGRREAGLASGLLALSYHHVWFSQNARGYSMLAFWALLSTYAIYRGLKEGGKGWFVLYGAAIGLGVYTHLTMVFTVVGQGIAALVWSAWPSDRDAGGAPVDVLFGLGVGTAVGALLYAPIFGQVLDFFLNTSSQLEGISTPSWALFETLRVLGVGLGASVGLLAAASLVGMGTWDYLRRDRLALALFALPGVVTLVGALLARGTMYPRFYFFLIGFAFLILIRGTTIMGASLVSLVVDESSERQPRQRLAGTLLATAMILVSAMSLRSNYRFPKQDFGGALDHVDTEAAPGDVIATVGVTTVPYRSYYERAFVELTDDDSLLDLMRLGRRVWVLYTFPRYLEASDASLTRRLREDCDTMSVFHGTVGDGAIRVCGLEPRPRAPGESP